MLGAKASIAILSVIAALHMYWGMGGSLGKGVSIPERNGQPLFAPGARATFAVGCLLAFAAVLIAMRARLVPSGFLGSLPRFATWGLVFIFAARAIGDFRYVGFFKRVRDTRFALFDTVFYSPLCCLLALLIATAALL
jgi:hypothetical protein